ncbi:MAG: family transposase [Proteobacteria bacterium]|nr:family transposase [Pseudomonadota bacterium]
MLLTRLLNACHHFPGFVYAGARLCEVLHTIQKFFDLIGTQRAERIEFVCSDMWKPNLDLIKKNCTGALNILDRFHVVAKLNLAIDETRVGEARQLIADGYEPVLKKSRWCLLKRPENLTDTQRIKRSSMPSSQTCSARCSICSTCPGRATSRLPCERENTRLIAFAMCGM